ncbi:hypothetical protein [Sinorhizobium medicae]|uniref:hypothetical protein n=1 Tax=Sinorhizobium medicae TaxID=110321 RepID=UPI001F25F77A|nr:hypothetical protein [Sinorhizobium medicae]
METATGSATRLAASAEIKERSVQKQAGHASAELARKYQQQRDRLRINPAGVGLQAPSCPALKLQGKN